MIYAIVQGYAYPDDVTVCPYCGGEIDVVSSNGYCHCAECDKRFAVVEYVKPTEDEVNA